MVMENVATPVILVSKEIAVVECAYIEEQISFVLRVRQENETEIVHYTLTAFFTSLPPRNDVRSFLSNSILAAGFLRKAIC